jgi:hypothetical protein
MTLGKDYVNRNVRKQQRMFTRQERLHHLSGTRMWSRRQFQDAPEAGSQSHGDSKTTPLGARQAGAPRPSPLTLALAPDGGREPERAVLDRPFTSPHYVDETPLRDIGADDLLVG